MREFFFKSVRRNHRLAAFTLLELLATVMIIGILVTLLFPFIQRSLDAARQARCVANLRQFGPTWAAYSSDNMGTVLPSYDHGAFWQELLMSGGYITISPDKACRTLDALQCPSNPGRSSNWRYTNYAYNYWLGFQTDDSINPTPLSFGVKMVSLDQPSIIPVLADAGVRSMGTATSLTPAMITQYNFKFITTGTGNSPGYIGYNFHFDPMNGRANFLMADGHVEALGVVEAQSRYDNKTLLLSRNNVHPNPPQSPW